MEYWDQVERILRASSFVELVRESKAWATSTGFGHQAYAVKLQDLHGRDRSDFLTFNDFTSEWAEGYEALRDPEIASRDARVMHVRAGMPSTAWNVRGEVGFTDKMIGKQAGQILRRAGEYGLRAGITVPISSPGVSWAFMTFTTDATFDLRDLFCTIAPMTYVASCLHVSARRLQGWDEARPRLTEREREVLRWAALGKTSWDISAILSVSERTVNFHLQGAARKLEVNGRQAACARAIALGLITL
ncbi:LuxR C-terminal-related transcriptional regulator [Sinorhizobium sp. NFACC03]|uniref:helix-turn-helix transcriptional regulator n=1 Tax=Sinorhizobium sp. NFACC03 TaxID=1566295 RepID=UPI00088C9532|nr:LuxR C-terminal-related transcriptional regulator [Sinorhizobium sp. NFACC03]SDA93688.1 Autoinducer binding domain-containing protein [Sinorhizobium sp. NFACC03]